MHPDRRFHWDDRDAIRRFVADVSFGTLFAGTPDGPRVVHLPVVWENDETLTLHVARGNAITRHLDDATGLFVVNGPDGYVSPSWYGLGPDEVPTWNYVAAELEGQVSRMDRDALAAQVRLLTSVHEDRLPGESWTPDKMDANRWERMLDAIVGFRLRVQAWRGTVKVNQNKPAAARLRAADGSAAAGRTAIAAMMRAWR
ncbi:negative transcriptional regulator, PaiB family [Sphingomonas guangdongensis]|uniref:Negative transcriptional regulator, PaiB family n=1 Tax=Sphingomonas guangdongensis TaxID=1141890 RepID=A0A285R2G1_9SPHN|nr:FMN-binding negative transcriptional regulator [Sphingomonas guangdongensis]SOB86557.1 negative transcriptional regulator, PaiB family [Sphingomonas guangdongensis]